MSYTYKELKAGEMLEIIDLASSNPKMFQMEMVKRSLCIDGKPIGEAAMELPFGQYMELAQKVMAANKLGDEAKKN